jgi:hypothetical protein
MDITCLAGFGDTRQTGYVALNVWSIIGSGYRALSIADWRVPTADCGLSIADWLLSIH